MNPFSSNLEEFHLDKILFTTALSGIILSTICLCYLTFKLKLNENIKSILKNLALQNLVSFILMAIGLLMVLVRGFRTQTTCYLIIFPVVFSFSGNFFWISLISSLRYYMTERASQTKILSQDNIKGFTKSMILIYYSFSILRFSLPYLFDFPDFSNYCSDPDLANNKKSRFVVIPGAFNILVWVLISIYHDFSLLKLVKEKESKEHEKHSENPLVPWKSSNDDYKSGVPIRSTAISTVSFIFLLIFFNQTFQQANGSEGNSWVTIATNSVWMALYLPMALLLTINHNKSKVSKKTKKQPPNGLQFHSSDDVVSKGPQFHDTITSRNDVENSQVEIELEEISTSQIRNDVEDEEKTGSTKNQENINNIEHSTNDAGSDRITRVCETNQSGHFKNYQSKAYLQKDIPEMPIVSE